MAANQIEIISVDPPVPSGISIVDPVTVMLRYRLAVPEGTLQVWFERFTDAACTVLGSTSSGGTTIAGSLGAAAGGSHQVSVTVSGLPLLDVAYVGVGVRLWTPDGSTALAEDMRYGICYAVKPPPPDLALVSPVPAAAPGTISGVVYADNNSNGRQDSGEPGQGSFDVTLSDFNCSAAQASARTDSSGRYTFPGLAPGTYCVSITYSGGYVSPGYWQRAALAAGSTQAANFGLQPEAPVAPPPSAAGYCGDGIANAALGEQCDPPNLTNCTASCQDYTAACGNGILDSGEQCDPPNTVDCTASCQNYTAYCGNGILDSGEQCDPPNTVDCTASCQNYTAVCGNGILDSGEQCDPPNVTFCTASCQLYLPNCGNSALDPGEECDPPNTTNCTAQCQNWP